MEYSKLIDKNLGFYTKYRSGFCDFLSLYKYKTEYYFTIIDGSYESSMICIGKIKFLKEIWEPVFMRNAVALVYLDDMHKSRVWDYYQKCNNRNIFEIIDSAHRIEHLNRPIHQEVLEEEWWWMLNDIWCFLTDSYVDWERWKKFSTEEFVNNKYIYSNYYGERLTKSCYLNPFNFERSNEYKTYIKENIKELEQQRNTLQKEIDFSRGVFKKIKRKKTQEKIDIIDQKIDLLSKR